MAGGVAPLIRYAALVLSLAFGLAGGIRAAARRSLRGCGLEFLLSCQTKEAACWPPEGTGKCARGIGDHLLAALRAAHTPACRQTGRHYGLHSVKPTPVTRAVQMRHGAH